jgi:hypothetical protein
MPQVDPQILAQAGAAISTSVAPIINGFLITHFPLSLAF